MEQAFKKIRPEDITGLGFWFWYVDGWCACNNLLTMMYGHPCENWSEVCVWIAGLIAFPFLYILLPLHNGFFAEKGALKLLKQGQYVTMCGRRSVEHCIIMNKLRGIDE